MTALLFDESASSNAPGTFGPYRVLHQLGSGILGPVFLAYDLTADRAVAVKTIKLDDQSPHEIVRVTDALRRVAAEALSHPGLVKVLDAGVEGAVPFLVTEVANGDTLDTMLRRSAPVGLDESLPILTQVADAVDTAWDAGVGHGALNPRDVFLVRTSVPVKVVVTGSGIAVALREAGVELPLRRPYAAPEWATVVDRQSDVYALGVIAHELLTGRRPHGPDDQDGAFAASLTPVARVHVRRLLSSALAPNPVDRFVSARAFVDALRQVAAGQQPVLPTPVETEAKADALEQPPGAAAPAPDVPVLPPLPSPAPEPTPVSIAAPRPEDDHSRVADEDLAAATLGSAEPVRHERPSLRPTWSVQRVALVAAGAILCLACGGLVGYALYVRQRSAAPSGAMAATDQPTPPAATNAPAEVAAPADSSAPPVAGTTASARPAAAPRVSPPFAHAAPTHAGLGTLVITSDPVGAMVLVDGHVSGDTPVTAHDLALGFHEVLVARTGHVPHTEDVTLSTASPVRTLRVVLEPGLAMSALAPAAPTEVGMLDVDSRPRGATVSVDGWRAGPSPLRVPEMSPGTHTVTIELGGYQATTRRVGVDPGRVSTLSVTLESLAR